MYFLFCCRRKPIVSSESFFHLAQFEICHYWIISLICFTGFYIWKQWISIWWRRWKFGQWKTNRRTWQPGHGSSFIFTDAGNFAVYATKGTLTSNVITVNVTAIASNAGYKHRVLIEEYSGTWCGNCPRILYGVDLLHLQTDKAIVVSTHLFNGDPYITTQGNDLAASQRVSGVPTGNINRTISWTGPQDENVNQVVNQIKASSNAGVAISSTLNGGNLLASIKVGYTQALSGNAKLTVYLVEDKLYNSQRNYSSNLYAGQSTIPNFEFNSVMRAVLSSLTGDDIGNAGSLNEKKYSLTIPSNISNINNARLVAFITNASGTVVNVQSAKVGEIKDFERL